MNFFSELCAKLNIDWSDISNNDLFLETELNYWLTSSKNEAVARYPWPMTEGWRDLTAVASQEKYDYPTTLKTDSIQYLTVDGKKYDKLRFEDFLTYKEDYATGTLKYFTDRGRVLHINYLAEDFTGSITCYGQVEVSGSVTSATTTSVFSTAEPEGDDAILKLAYAKALSSEKMKNPNMARKERLEAFETLDGIWKRIADRQHTYQTKDRPMFKRLNVLRGRYEDEIYKRNQF